MWNSRRECWNELVELSISGEVIASLRIGDDIPPLASNLGGPFLCPGLVDAHVHVTQDPSRLTGRLEGARALELQAELNLASAAKAGITSVRDVGSLGRQWRELLPRLRQSRARSGGARLFSAGQHITRATGHVSASGWLAPNAGMDGLSTFVKELAEAGADFVKLMNDPVVFTREELMEIAAECEIAGLPLAIHAFTSDSVLLAKDAQFKSIEHLGDYSADAWDAICAADAFVITTFVAAFDSACDPRGTLPSEILSDVSDQILDYWYQACCASIAVGIPATVMLALGTDAGFPGTSFDSIHREMALLELHGQDRVRLLTAATLHAGLLCGGRVGAIEPGKYADVLVYASNPLLRSNFMAAPSAVWLGGERVSTLDQTARDE